MARRRARPAPMKIKGNPHTVAELAPKKNAFQVAVSGDRIIIKAWPRKRGRAAQGFPLWHQKEFGYAARYASRADPLAWETAKNWTDGTSMVPRDLLTMAALGLGFTFVDQDGNRYESWRMANPNPQIILDLISNQPGTIVYRNNQLWVPVSGGLPGQSLIIDANRDLQWATRDYTTPNQTARSLLTGQSTSASAFAFKGQTIQSTRLIYAHSLSALLDARVAGTYRALLAELDNDATDPEITAVHFGPAQTLAAASSFQWAWLPFDPPVALEPSKLYALLAGRTDSTDTYVLPIRAAGTVINYLGPGPWINGVVADCAKKSPAIGDTVATAGLAAPSRTLALEWSLP